MAPHLKIVALRCSYHIPSFVELSKSARFDGLSALGRATHSARLILFILNGGKPQECELNRAALQQLALVYTSSLGTEMVVSRRRKERGKSLSNQTRLCMKMERTAALSVGTTPEFELEFS